MSIPFLLYLMSCITLVITKNVEVLNYTYVENTQNSISVFNFSKGQNTTDSLTVCTWAKSPGLNVDFLGMQKKNQDGHTPFVYGNIDYEVNKIYGNVNFRGFVSYELCLPNDTWIHICLRLRANEANIFYYGTPTSVKYTSDPYPYTDFLLDSIIEVGSVGYNDDFYYETQFFGQLYNFNVWKKSLSDNDIKKLAKCRSPKMEGDLVAWSKLVNGVKNGDEDLVVNPARVTVLMDKGPCPNPKLPDCSEDGGGNQNGNSEPGTSSEGMSDPGSSLDQTGNSDPGTISEGMSDPDSSLDQTGNSDPETSFGGMSDPGSSFDQTGKPDPVTSSGGMSDPGSSLD